jgi:hypothetical protein
VAARFDCDERGVGAKHAWRDHEGKVVGMFRPSGIQWQRCTIAVYFPYV